MSAEYLESPGLLLLHLQAGNWFSICLRHGEAARSRIAWSKCIQGLSQFPPCAVWGEAKSHAIPSSSPHCVKETSLHVCSCCRALLQCGGSVCKKRWMWGSAGGGYSCLAQLCGVSLEGVLSGFLLRPADRLKCSPMHRLFLSICRKLCAS